MGVDDPPVGSAPISPGFLQGKGHIIPPQSIGSGTLNREDPAADWTPGTLIFSTGCQATTAQTQTGLLRWSCFGPAYSWWLMLEFLAAHGRLWVLVSPGLTLLVLPADHLLRRVGWSPEGKILPRYYPRREDSSMRGNWQKHMWHVAKGSGGEPWRDIHVGAVTLSFPK